MFREIWFIFGLSGAGKTYLGEYLSKRNYLHMEIDGGITERDCFDKYGLWTQWETFMRMNDPGLLLSEIKTKYEDVKKEGAVLSFFSHLIIDSSKIVNLSEMSKILFLRGPAEFCIRSFLKRVAEENRDLDEKHWQIHNSALIEHMKDFQIQRFCIDVFNPDGTRKSIDEILAQARKL